MPVANGDHHQGSSSLSSPFCPSEEPIPVVLVEGFLGRGVPGYWGPLDAYNKELNDNGAKRKRRKLIFVHLGTVSSLHDRACELYFQIKGGRVDYGKKHSSVHGHERYGRRYDGLYPDWSSSRPLHFIGHSFGGVTVWYLQQLLMRGYFSKFHDAEDSSGEQIHRNRGDWIRSLTGLNSPFRGTTASYILGEREDIPARVRPFSFGSLLYRIIHLYVYLDLPQSVQSVLYDFNIDHWNFAFSKHIIRDGGRVLADHLKPLKNLIRNLACSPWAEGRDSAAFDLTLRRMERVNRKGRICTKTYYQSFIGSMTKKRSWSKYHIPSVHPVLPLSALSYFIGRHSFKSQKLLDEISGTDNSPETDWEDEDDEVVVKEEKLINSHRHRRVPNSGRHLSSEWWENDGVCPTVSQKHPGTCEKGYCRCSETNGSFYSETLRSTYLHPRCKPLPGLWKVHHLPSTSHVDIVPDAWGTLFGTKSPAKSPSNPDNAVVETPSGYSVGRFLSKCIPSSVFRPVQSALQTLIQSVRTRGTCDRRAVRESRHGMFFDYYFRWLAVIDDVDNNTQHDGSELSSTVTIEGVTKKRNGTAKRKFKKVKQKIGKFPRWAETAVDRRRR